MIAGLVLVSAGFLLILLFRHDLSVTAVVVSFIVLELGVGVSQTISNDTIVASVPAAKAGAASAVSETAYELGAVVGTATLGTIFTAFYRSNVALPGGLTEAQAADAPRASAVRSRSLAICHRHSANRSRPRPARPSIPVSRRPRSPRR